ncbi:MAG: ribosome maturation factor RimP [Nitrospirae bacterium]|nr:MAG: ribosome maturation factor RimP [Nitrospirota bacterium]
MNVKDSEVEQKAVKLARQIAGEQAVEVIGVNLFGRGNRMLLRVTLDKEGGVTLEDCERFSRSLGLLLETEDLMPGSYNLEVSSPGLDRPLTAPVDFERNTGKLVRVTTRDKIDNQNFFIGRISAVSASFLRLSVDKKELEIPFESILKARLEIEIK